MRIDPEYACLAGFSQGLGAGHGRNCTAPAESAYSFPMTCACKSVHPFPCQFPAESVFFDFDGKKWCRFHLPLQDAAGNKSPKGLGENGWEEGGEERRAFNKSVLISIEAASQHRNPETQADFRGIAFPGGFLGGDPRNLILHVNFERATFGDRGNVFVAQDYTTHFVSDVSFTGAVFYGPVSFDSVQIDGVVNFAGATFKGVTSFRQINFKIKKLNEKEICFNGATFENQVDFNHTSFVKDSFFKDVTFKNIVCFNNAQFAGRAEFNNTIFEKHVRFDNTVFKGKTDFSDVKFGGEANFSAQNASNFPEIKFSNSVFSGPALFRNRDFTTNANFNGAVFKDLAEFHGCTFHPAMSFHQTQFLKTRGANDAATEELERSYRTLKLEMERLRARNEEADFFALEMECRRQRSDVPRTERIAATAYNYFSNYGRSIARPLIWMGFLIGYSFSYFYHLAQLKSYRAPGQILRFVLEQITTPFSIWRGGYAADPWMGAYLEKCPLLLRAPATVMTIAALALTTLFLLALRRRFKMD